DGLEQRYRKETAKPNSGKSRSVEASIGGHVSLARKKSTGTFMVAETDSLKRKKE
ncbi:hypothetical protein Ancab_021658, partial [Ancistrocladus abbreviatus]